jgi:hypothetical protein
MLKRQEGEADPRTGEGVINQVTSRWTKRPTRFS